MESAKCEISWHGWSWVCIKVEVYGQFQLRESVYNEAFLDRVEHWTHAICQKNWALPSCLGGPDKHECEKSH
jgi:hypothetical protein